ncbi:MAG: PEP-CTERM sorting domain-containing protein [Burkholderiales bacterium]
MAIRALATTSTGSLFAVNDGGLSANDRLWRIDPVTGAGTLMGDTGRTGLQRLAADATDALFGWDVNSGLQQLSAASGVASQVGAATVPSASIQTLAFAADGRLYGAESALYRIDPNSGSTTFVGPTGASGNFSNVRGLEFTSARVPEPATLGLLAAALLASARSRRQQTG